MGALYITGKDLHLLLRDPRALMILVVLPLIFISIFGMSAGHIIGLDNENQMLQIALVNEVDCDDVEIEEDWYEEETLADPDAEAVPPADSETAAPLVDPADAGAPTDEPGFEDTTFAPTEEDKALMRKNCRQLVQEVIDRLDNEAGVKVHPVDRATAEQWIAEGQPHVMVVIGKDFFKKIQTLKIGDAISTDKGKLVDKLAYFDISSKSRSSIAHRQSNVEDVVFGKVLGTVGPYLACEHNVIKQAMAENICEQYMMHGSSLPLPPPESSQEYAKNRADVIYQELIPQFTVAFVFFLLTVMARSFLHERHQGTLRRLRLAPIRPVSILVGKTIPFFVISVLQTVLLFTTGKLLFGMSMGAQPWALVPVVFSTSLAATGLGLLVATVVRTDSQVSWVGNAIVLTTAGISGCFMPRDWMPPLMQQISRVTPHAWALEAFKQLLSFDHPSLPIVFFNCGVLLVFAMLFFAVGSVRVAYVE